MSFVKEGRGSPIHPGDCSIGHRETVIEIMAVHWDRMGEGRTLSTPAHFWWGFRPVAGLGLAAMTASMTRNEAVQSLIRWDRPLEAVRTSLGAFDWDWEGEPGARLDVQAVASVLRRYLAGELTGEEVEAWANLLEGREDVDFQPEAGAAIFDLANPVLQGSVAEVAPALLSRR